MICVLQFDAASVSLLERMLADPDRQRGIALAFGPGLAAEGFHFERAA